MAFTLLSDRRGTLNFGRLRRLLAASTMGWWHKMVAPARRMWFGVAKCVRIRKTGLLKLRNDVRTCEYEDVHVLWEMLERNESQLAIARTKPRQFWNIRYWATHASYCHRF